jgi:hypothetical protein
VGTPPSAVGPLLAAIVIDLGAELARLNQVVKEGMIASSELRWVANLAQAQTDLALDRAGLDASPPALSPQRLEQTFRRLGRVLQLHPSQVNARLNQVAKDLKLGDLAAVMRHILDRLRYQGDGPDPAAQFGRGVEALDRLNRGLDAILQEHDRWQAIEADLRRIEVGLESDLADLELSWPILRSEVEDLCGPDEDDETRTLGENGRKLTKAIDARNTAAVLSSFGDFRRLAGLRFFQVDVTLLNFSGSLREIGDPLDAILDVLKLAASHQPASDPFRARSARNLDQ